MLNKFIKKIARREADCKGQHNDSSLWAMGSPHPYAIKKELKKKQVSTNLEYLGQQIFP